MPDIDRYCPREVLLLVKLCLQLPRQRCYDDQENVEPLLEDAESQSFEDKRWLTSEIDVVVPTKRLLFFFFFFRCSVSSFFCLDLFAMTQMSRCTRIRGSVHRFVETVGFTEAINDQRPASGEMIEIAAARTSMGKTAWR